MPRPQTAPECSSDSERKLRPHRPPGPRAEELDGWLRISRLPDAVKPVPNRGRSNSLPLRGNTARPDRMAGISIRIAHIALALPGEDHWPAPHNPTLPNRF